jgi:hypothetical protein
MKGRGRQEEDGHPSVGAESLEELDHGREVLGVLGHGHVLLRPRQARVVGTCTSKEGREENVRKTY